MESYIVGECQFTWGPAEGLEEDMQALIMAANIMGEDFGEWSELDDPHKVHSVHGDSTEGEMTDTLSDDMLPLVDAASAEICSRYIDDNITYIYIYILH